MRKKLIAVLTILMLLISLLPISAMAERPGYRGGTPTYPPPYGYEDDTYWDDDTWDDGYWDDDYPDGAYWDDGYMEDDYWGGGAWEEGYDDWWNYEAVEEDTAGMEEPVPMVPAQTEEDLAEAQALAELIEPDAPLAEPEFAIIPAYVTVGEGETYFAGEGTTVFNNGGTVFNNLGTVYNNGGTVYNNDGVVFNNAGIVWSNGGEVFNNGGTVWSNGATVRGGEEEQPAEEPELQAETEQVEYPEAEDEMPSEMNEEPEEIVLEEAQPEETAAEEAAEEVILPLRAEKPVFSIESGRYSEAQTVEILAQEGCEIWYSTDGKALSEENAFLYTEPITVDKSCVILAVAIGSGMEDSEPARLTLRILPPESDNA